MTPIGFGAIAPVAAAGQTLAPIAPVQPAQACPVCAHCASLPSSDSAYEAVSGVSGGWWKVAGTTLLRAGLVGAGIATYDKIAGVKHKRLVQRAIAGAVGIELFVLAWTWFKAPRTQ